MMIPTPRNVAPTMGARRARVFALAVGLGALAAAPSALAVDDTMMTTMPADERPTRPGATIDLLDPRLRGVSLTDVGIDEGHMVAAYLRKKGVLPVNAVMSTSIAARFGDHLIVDVIARAPRFQDTDSKKHKDGRVGLLRVRVPVASADGLCDVGEPEVLLERSLVDLDLRYRVSVTEWAGVIDEPATGFRRVFPLGGGSIDRGVRVPGFLTVMTPTTEDGLLEKTYAWRELNSPWYFKKKPYLPISVARTYKKADDTLVKYYAESNIAFHIWQDKGFARGFFSHGCMRMRDDDLAELAAFVFGAARPIPIVLRVGPIGDALHPYPFDTQHYWQLKNYGTPEKPKTRIKYMLYETEKGTEPLPPLDHIRPMTFLEKPIYDTPTGASAPAPTPPVVPARP